MLWEYSDETHPMSASQMVEQLAAYGIICERKAVYRYIGDLENFGFDIMRTRQGFFLVSRLFELPELKLLVDAVQSSTFITEKKSEELIGKLSGLLSIGESTQLRRQVHVHNRIKSMNESIYYNVDSIFEAMEHNQQIAFTYWNWNVKKEMIARRNGGKYIISPWLLRWDAERYYLVGYDGDVQQLRHYRVDKMKDISVVPQIREGKIEFEQLNLSDCKTATFGMFQGKRERVTLWADNSLAGVMMDRFGRDVWLHPINTDQFSISVDVVVSRKFYGWLTGLGTGVKIVSPDWVNQEYRELLKKILESSSS